MDENILLRNAILRTHNVSSLLRDVDGEAKYFCVYGALNYTPVDDLDVSLCMSIAQDIWDVHSHLWPSLHEIYHTPAYCDTDPDCCRARICMSDQRNLLHSLYCVVPPFWRGCQDLRIIVKSFQTLQDDGYTFLPRFLLCGSSSLCSYRLQYCILHCLPYGMITSILLAMPYLARFTTDQSFYSTLMI